MCVAVSFGKSKIYTALVFEIHQHKPTAYQAKDIYQILDEKPLVTSKQLKHWQWISDYYMCSLGEVFRAALPSAFLLESETIILKNNTFSSEEDLTDNEFLIVEALQHQSQLNLQQIMQITGKTKVFSLIKQLLEKEAIIVKEEIYEQYKPKVIQYIRLQKQWEAKLDVLLEKLKRAKKQREVVLHYFQLQASTQKPIKKLDIQKQLNTSAAVINALVDKDFFEIYEIQVDRINFKGNQGSLKILNEFQAQAYKEIKECFLTKDVCLFHGITSSGKTEIYVQLIKEVLEQNKQVLYLLPEIALTTQLLQRLQVYFGEQISVFHSKYSMNERVEVYNNILNSKTKAQVIVGARSSIFLPFVDLGLIIVDEEHETSYKQFDPSPRYHARDAAIVLGLQHKAKIVLGSATPSIESYYNAQQQKYGLVNLNRRFGNVLLPEVELVNIKEKQRKKRMNGHFSDRLLKLIEAAIAEKEQIILFQNRRGFSPIITCTTCGESPQCPNCDVSLTYHKYIHKLKCHYCGYYNQMPINCFACGNATLDTKGFGTEQIELELKALYPDLKIARLDMDTTRGKHSYQKILGAFQAHEIDVLVGTQMLSKGLDFSNVSLVGVLNADNMLNFPDFRAHERSFQMLVQVSGRAGRAKKRGKVAIQTYNPYHQILQQVSTNSYTQMYKEQIQERWQYKYPPFYRTIKIVLKHRDYQRLETASNWLGKALQAIFKEHLLGPTTPAISRIRNQYLKNAIIKIPQQHSLNSTKEQLLKVKNVFQSVKEFRAIRFIIDVDNY